MKIKIIIFFSIITSLFVNSVFSQQDNANQQIFNIKNIELIKINSLYGLKDKVTNKIIIPAIYDNIVSLGKNAVAVKKSNKSGVLSYNNKIIIPVEYGAIFYNDVNINNNLYSNYYAIDNNKQFIKSKIFIPQNSNFLNKYNNLPNNKYIYTFFKQSSWENYFIHKENNNTYSTILQTYKHYYFPDKEALYSQNEHISLYTNAIIVQNENNKWGIINIKGDTLVKFMYDKIITFDSIIDENFIIGYDKNNQADIVGVNYKNIQFPIKDKFIAIKGNTIDIIDINGKVLYSGKKPEIKYNINSPNMIEDIIRQNNSVSPIKFINFPQNGIVRYYQPRKNNSKFKDEITILVNNKGNFITAKYPRAYAKDTYSLIYELLGISFDLNSKPGVQPIAKINNSVTFDKDGVYITYNSIDFNKNNMNLKNKVLVSNNNKFYDYVGRKFDYDNKGILLVKDNDFPEKTKINEKFSYTLLYPVIATWGFFRVGPEWEKEWNIKRVKDVWSDK